MKVLCDVCEKAVASLVCCADEAALCSDCDTRIHAANKLASKHQRVPLFTPPPSEPTRCDICQERSAFFFCLEDRALLCRECDVSIHSANALAANHKRFLVTGVRVGLNAVGAPDYVSEQTPARSAGRNPAASNSKTASKVTHSSIANGTLPQPSPLLRSTPRVSIQRVSSGRTHFFAPVLTTSSADEGTDSDPGPVSSDPGRVSDKNSSISEYLTHGIPGWKLEELLTDLAGGFNNGDAPSSKADVPNAGEHDSWLAELMMSDDQVSAKCPAEVPQLPSPPTASGLSRGKANFSIRSKMNYDFLFGSDIEEDDVSIVPDIGRTSSPSAHPAPKRPRPFLEL